MGYSCSVLTKEAQIAQDCVEWPDELTTEDLALRLKEAVLIGLKVEECKIIEPGSDEDEMERALNLWWHDLSGVLEFLGQPIDRVFIDRNKSRDDVWYDQSTQGVWVVVKRGSAWIRRT